jgi:hypothetical protein
VRSRGDSRLRNCLLLTPYGTLAGIEHVTSHFQHPGLTRYDALS